MGRFLSAASLVLSAFVAILAQTRPANAPDVILITIDTLRADRLGCYGYRNIETPNIDSVARDGIRFANAVAQCPITLPSHCSILTGTNPIYHGVRDNSGYRLPSDRLTLAETLKQYGYRTGAFVGAYVLDSKTGLNQGFDTYVDGFQTSNRGETDLSIAQHRAGKVMASALAWLKKAKAGEKSFAWIHLFDPHAPYDPPPPFSKRYSSDPYNGEIAYVDSVIGELIAYLKARSLYSSTLLTIISDHGEGLGEHGEATHGLFLYDSTLRIPWIIKPPVLEGEKVSAPRSSEGVKKSEPRPLGSGPSDESPESPLAYARGSESSHMLPARAKYAGRIIAEQVQSIDLMPTVLQFLGKSKPDSVQGIGLLSMLEGKKTSDLHPALGETLLPRDQYGWSPLLSIRTQDHKFIQAPKPELYDLRRDPQEKLNLFSSNRALADQLRQQRESLASRYSGKNATQARMRFQDPVAFQRLLGLGYVAISGDSIRDAEAESLPDPKDKVATFDLLWAAAADNEKDRYVQAIGKLKQVLASDPKTYIARTLLGVTYFKMGSFPLAAEELKAALSLRPNDLTAMFHLGMALARMGENRAAENIFQKVLELDPENDGALNNLGIVYLNEKRFNEAMEIFHRRVQSSPRDSFAWTNLGLAYMNQNRNTEAIRALRRALEIDRHVPQIYNNLGLALMNSGQRPEAIQQYRRAISLDPDYTQAHYNLALALKQQGLDAEAKREMEMAKRLFERQTNKQ
ncbi:MAG TPA: sulfatase-like hydrolase/transferase [Acidobacteriota bacterium]|nr:sulfatase-like hydrolase/transferase [Acidobacteriota bacterium]